jgi:hypothetical protein
LEGDLISLEKNLMKRMKGEEKIDKQKEYLDKLLGLVRRGVWSNDEYLKILCLINEEYLEVLQK